MGHTQHPTWDMHNTLHGTFTTPYMGTQWKEPASGGPCYELMSSTNAFQPFPPSGDSTPEVERCPWLGLPPPLKDRHWRRVRKELTITPKDTHKARHDIHNTLHGHPGGSRTLLSPSLRWNAQTPPTNQGGVGRQQQQHPTWDIHNTLHGTYTTPYMGHTQHPTRDIHNTLHGTCTTPYMGHTHHPTWDIHNTLHGTYTTPYMGHTQHPTQDIHKALHKTYTTPYMGHTQHLISFWNNGSERAKYSEREIILMHLNFLLNFY